MEEDIKKLIEEYKLGIEMYAHKPFQSDAEDSYDMAKRWTYEEVISDLERLLNKHNGEKCVVCGGNTEQSNLKVCNKCASKYKF